MPSGSCIGIVPERLEKKDRICQETARFPFHCLLACLHENEIEHKHQYRVSFRKTAIHSFASQQAVLTLSGVSFSNPADIHFRHLSGKPGDRAGRGHCSLTYPLRRQLCAETEWDRYHDNLNFLTRETHQLSQSSDN